MTKKKNTPAQAEKSLSARVGDLLQDMNAWRAIAVQCCPDVADKPGNATELATLLRDTWFTIGKYWQEMDRVARKEAKVTVSMALSLNRTTAPVEVNCRLGGAEKFGGKHKMFVPDPTSPELPLYSEGTDSEGE